MDVSAITCDEIIEVEAKSNGKETKKHFNEKHFNQKKYKTQTVNILLTSVLITIALLIAASIYCYPIKY